MAEAPLSDKKHRKVLLLACLDQSPTSECVLGHTKALASAFDSSVILYTVLEPSKEHGHQRATDALSWEIASIEAEQYLDKIREKLTAASFDVATEVEQGHPAERIIQFAHDQHVTFTVLSSHGERGETDWHVGSTTQKVISNSRSSLFLVPSHCGTSTTDEQISFKKILIPLDGSPHAENLLKQVIPIAKYHHSEVILLHVIVMPELLHSGPLPEQDQKLLSELQERNKIFAKEYLGNFTRRLDSEGVVARSVVLSQTDVRQALLDFIEQENVDLVTLSAHGQVCNKNWLYGSVTTSLLLKPLVPLLVIQDMAPDEAESILRDREAAKERIRVGSSRFDE